MPADFFLVAAPSSYDMESSTEYRANRSVGETNDHQSGATFRPYYYLGGSVTLAVGPRCLDTVAVFRHHEPASGDVSGGSFGGTPHDLSRLTRIDAVYGSPAAGVTCVPGTGNGEGADLLVSSFAKDSTFAAAYRDEIVSTANEISVSPNDGDYLTAGTAPFVIGLQPYTAYVVNASDGTSIALTEIGSTTIVVQGPFTKAEVPQLLNRLEVR